MKVNVKPLFVVVLITVDLGVKKTAKPKDDTLCLSHILHKFGSLLQYMLGVGNSVPLIKSNKCNAHLHLFRGSSSCS